MPRWRLRPAADLVRGNHSHFAPGRFVFGQALLGDVGPSLLIAVGNRNYFVVPGGRNLAGTGRLSGGLMRDRR